MNCFELVTELRTPKSTEEIMAELDKMNEKIYKKFLLLDEEQAEERNDVYIYNTIKYPPKSTPPTANKIKYSN
jgi:hypothetical protein